MRSSFFISLVYFLLSVALYGANTPPHPFVGHLHDHYHQDPIDIRQHVLQKIQYFILPELRNHWNLEPAHELLNQIHHDMGYWNDTFLTLRPSDQLWYINFWNAVLNAMRPAIDLLPRNQIQSANTLRFAYQMRIDLQQTEERFLALLEFLENNLIIFRETMVNQQITNLITVQDITNLWLNNLNIKNRHFFYIELSPNAFQEIVLPNYW